MSDLRLFLGQEVAGTVSRTTAGTLTFSYDSDYVGKEQPVTPVSVSMPTQVAAHSDKQIGPWLWGLLPDSDAVLNRWAREFHVSANSAFSLLATPLGEDCPGAVRLIPADRVESVRADQPLTEIDWLTEAQVAQRLRDLTNDTTAWLGASRTGRFSLAGAQAKTALFFDGQRWGQPQGSLATSYILKPAIVGFADHDLNEHICLSAMRIAGLRAVQTRVERFEDQSAIVVRRYDRLIQDDRQIRVHQEDLCQALSVHSGNKYQNEGGPGPRDIAALFQRIMPRSIAREATESFLDALVWNWVIAGTDAHAKNYSLLLSGDQVRLAPFYDVASALPYDIAEQKLRLAMKFGNDYRVNPGNSPWKHLAAALQLPEDVVRSRAGRVIAAAPDAFATAAADPGVQAVGSSLPQRLVDLIASRTIRCARYLQ